MRPGILIPIPGRPLSIEALLLDLNGTLARDGILLAGVAELVRLLATHVDVLVASGDTFGSAGEIADEFGLQREELGPTSQAEQKLALVERLGAHRTAVIGNGRNDALALARAALGICVIGPEGCAAEAVSASDVLAPSPAVALGCSCIRTGWWRRSARSAQAPPTRKIVPATTRTASMMTTKARSGRRSVFRPTPPPPSSARGRARTAPRPSPAPTRRRRRPAWSRA